VHRVNALSNMITLTVILKATASTNPNPIWIGEVSTIQNLAEIRLWNKKLGALSYDPTTQITTFEYTSIWINTGVEIAPLHMPLPESGQQRKFQFANLNPATYKGLPAIFADTLPDDFGNAVINAWLAKNGRDVGSFTSLERLL